MFDLLLGRRAADNRAAPRRKRKLPTGLVRSAIDLFVEKGVDGTTIREIAERAGVSEGALYRHYASKEELACSIFLTHLQQLTGELAVAIEGASDYRSKIRAFVETCLAAYEDDSRLFTYLIVSEYREFATLPEGNAPPGPPGDGDDRPRSGGRELCAASTSTSRAPSS